MQRLVDEMTSKQEEVKMVERKKEQADDVLKEQKKEAGKISRELAKLEQDIREVVIDYIQTQSILLFTFVLLINRKPK